VRAMLDTNAYSALMRGVPAVAAHVRRSTRLYLPAVALGELLYGFRNGSQYGSNRRQLEAFLASPYVEFVPVDMSTCERFGIVAALLRRKGRPIPGNDVWIAAQALQTGADLLTFDRHFEAVDGLSVLLLQR